MTIDLDPTLVAQIDELARRLGIQEVGEHREARRRQEVVRRLLMFWCSMHPNPPNPPPNTANARPTPRRVRAADPK